MYTHIHIWTCKAIVIETYKIKAVMREFHGNMDFHGLDL